MSDKEATVTADVPWPGSKEMPQWTSNELIDAPVFTKKNWFALLGPGLILGGAAIGGGEWLVGPKVTALYGGSLLWLATLSILGQVIYNIEISRYTLYTGEPIFTGKFRTMPGPKFWVFAYLFFDFGSVFPYLAAAAATPVVMLLLNGNVPDPENVARDFWLMKGIGYLIFIGALIPLLFGGKIYHSLKIIMTFKLIVVFGFLLFLAFFFSRAGTWVEITTGFVKFGTVPVLADEDANGNGVLDPGEDFDLDNNLDVVETVIARDDSGKITEFEDIDGDGKRDGANVENMFVSLFTGKGMPDIDFTMVAFIAALAAIAGSGGLSNTPTSNFTRDHGWGMGHHVGAIPSMIGGHDISLSHVGCVFEPTEESLPRWRGWYKHVCRDQLAVWLPACFVGMALPAMLSIQFLARGTEAGNWTMAVITAEGVKDSVSEQSGTALGSFCWFMTIFCGFLVLAPTMSSSADGIIRRWVDVFWTSSARLREMDTKHIKVVYFKVLIGYAIFGLFMLSLKPSDLITYATMFFNIGLGFSCWHTLFINMTLLPKPLRPGWFVRCALSLAGAYYMMLGAFAIAQTTGFLG